MIEKQFWINVKEAWIVAAQPKITNVHDDSEGATDFSVPDDSEDMEVSFDDIGQNIWLLSFPIQSDA